MVQARRTSALSRNDEVRGRVAASTAGDLARLSAYPDRARQQRDHLALPVLPITTIGSFPQTQSIRRARADHAKGVIDDEAYRAAMRAEIEQVVRAQEELGVDVIVHGEAERNDMVQYFAGQLVGVISTEHGWVQSYGTRCVRPPIIAGDIARPEPMSVEWSRYAQSLTSRPVKGMLTGPVTMLAWSFVRDDQPLADTARSDGAGVAGRSDRSGKRRDQRDPGRRAGSARDPAAAAGRPGRPTCGGRWTRSG